MSDTSDEATEADPYDRGMRNTARRQADAQRRLEREANVWIATASSAGVPHLVPLSLGWNGTQILVATPGDTPTARNARESGVLKASLDDADDVVLIDATVDVVDFATADEALVDSYVERVGWNPADETGEWVLLIVAPRTVRSWNGVGETAGRVIMRDGAWLD